MKTKLTFLLILLICPLINAQEIYKKEKDYFSTKILKHKINVPEKSTLEILSSESLQGNINIITTNENIITIDYVKSAKTEKMNSAVDIIDLIGVSLEKTNKGALLKLRAPNPVTWDKQKESAILDIDLTIPVSYKINIDAPYFDILASGPFAEFVVPNSLGRLEISNVSDYLELSTSNRNVMISNVSGEINISARNSTVSAFNINSKKERVTIYNEGGEIKMKDIEAELNIKNNYGKINITNFKAIGQKNYIRSLHGSIYITVDKINTDQLVVNNRFEDIELFLPIDVSAEISLAVEEGSKIEVSGFLFSPGLIQENRLNLTAGKGKSVISSLVRGKGNIYIKSLTEAGN